MAQGKSEEEMMISREDGRGSMKERGTGWFCAPMDAILIPTATAAAEQTRERNREYEYRVKSIEQDSPSHVGQRELSTAITTIQARKVAIEIQTR